MSKKDLGWKDWKLLTRLTVGDLPKKIAGVYKIGATSKRGAAIKIPRCLGIDEKGILDIGESIYLRRRMRQFLNCAEDEQNNTKGHMAGWRYRYLELDAEAKFPLRRLQFKWAKTGKGESGKNKAVKKEAKLMKKYINKYSELPPLNYKYNWK